jgi:hypothetical protein
MSLYTAYRRAESFGGEPDDCVTEFHPGDFWKTKIVSDTTPGAAEKFAACADVEDGEIFGVGWDGGFRLYRAEKKIKFTTVVTVHPA